MPENNPMPQAGGSYTRDPETGDLAPTTPQPAPAAPAEQE